jgi:predicted O-methyltransferase YrrM
MANDVLRSILANRTVVTESGIERPLHSATSEDEGAFLQSIIREHKPKCSLEIGCAYGISSLYICEALREAVSSPKHIIIDPAQFSPYHKWLGEPGSGWEGIGLLNLKRAGYEDIIEFHNKASYECLPVLLKNAVKIDFAFVDGQHTFDYVMVDFFFIDKLLNVRGIVAFDDFSYPSIRKVCRYALTNMRYSVVGPLPSKKGSRLRRFIQRIAGAAPKRFSELVNPEYRALDETMGLSRDYNHVALRKEADDLIGIGANTTRVWGTHNPF